MRDRLDERDKVIDDLKQKFDDADTPAKRRELRERIEREEDRRDDVADDADDLIRRLKALGVDIVEDTPAPDDDGGGAGDSDDDDDKDKPKPTRFVRRTKADDGGGDDTPDDTDPKPKPERQTPDDDRPVIIAP